MNDITDVELLQKTVLFQSCLIAGHSIEAIFRNESEYFLGESNANLLILCVYQKDHLKLEFILDKNGILHDYLRRYHVHEHTLALDTLKKESQKHFKGDEDYYITDTIQSLLIDSMPKHIISHFEEMHQLTHMVNLQLNSIETGEPIGYLLFGYFDNKEPNLTKLKNLKRMMQRIISPFHDEKTNTFRNRCIQVVTETPILTTKERHVLKYLLAAKSYADIAEELNISVNTVKTHVKNIYAKYDVKSKLELSNKINSGNAR